MALGAEKQIRNPGHHFTNAELAHCPSPRISTILPHLNFVDYRRRAACPTTKARKKAGYFLAHLISVQFLASEDKKTLALGRTNR
jgi:hypothetical protein